MTRIEKYEYFQNFKKQSKNLFLKISSDYKNDEEIKKYFGFSVAPGGRNCGLNDRQVDVFYGHRPINIQRYINSDLSISTQTEMENGCQITFQHLNDGRTIIYLYPSWSDSLKPSEEFIILKVLRNPKKLLNEKYLKKLYRKMKSYMAVTCSENIANIRDKITTFNLRFFKEICLDKKIQVSKFFKGLINLAKIVFTVGFSGFCLAFIPFFSNSKQLNELTNKIKEINRELQKIEIIQNELITKTDFSNQILKVSDEELLSKLNSELAEINKEIKDINAKVEKKK